MKYGTRVRIINDSFFEGAVGVVVNWQDSGVAHWNANRNVLRYLVGMMHGLEWFEEEKLESQE